MATNRRTPKNWVEAMIEREATPKPARKEKVGDFCARWGIDTSTYYFQARKKENRKKVVEIWLCEAIKGGNEVLEKLRENALNGKEKSIEMYLKFVLELKEQMDLTTDGKELPTPIISLTDKQS
jgi:hypothetical protein